MYSRYHVLKDTTYSKIPCVQRYSTMYSKILNKQENCTNHESKPITDHNGPQQKREREKGGREGAVRRREGVREEEKGRERVRGGKGERRERGRGGRGDGEGEGKGRERGRGGRGEGEGEGEGIGRSYLATSPVLSATRMYCSSSVNCTAVALFGITLQGRGGGGMIIVREEVMVTIMREKVRVAIARGGGTGDHHEGGGEGDYHEGGGEGDYHEGGEGDHHEGRRWHDYHEEGDYHEGGGDGDYREGRRYG